MDEIIPSAEIADSGTRQNTDEHAMSTWPKGLAQFGQHGVKEATEPSLILMFYEADSYDLEHMATPPPSRLECGPRSQVIAQATQAIRTSGGPLLLSFLSFAWHLRIATANVTLPGLWDTESFVYGDPTSVVVIRAKLSVLPQANPLPRASSNAQSVWLVAARKDNDVEISSFLRTVLLEPVRRTSE